jgi:hypothetical protein
VRRVIVLGAETPRVQSAELRVDCLPWDDLKKGFNLLDYDTPIVNLLSFESPDEVEWTALKHPASCRAGRSSPRPERPARV